MRLFYIAIDQKKDWDEKIVILPGVTLQGRRSKPFILFIICSLRIQSEKKCRKPQNTQVSPIWGNQNSPLSGVVVG